MQMARIISAQIWFRLGIKVRENANCFLNAYPHRIYSTVPLHSISNMRCRILVICSINDKISYARYMHVL
jgi:hypothetical protein